jgi:hypothetical protein
MKTFLLEMLAAQTTLLQQPPQSPLRRSILHHLVEIVPAPILAHFLRLVEHDRYGGAVVRHGVCSGCHLRLSASQAAALVNSDDLHLCENCSCYLLLPPEEHAEPAPRQVPVVASTRRQSVSA